MNGDGAAQILKLTEQVGVLQGLVSKGFEGIDQDTVQLTQDVNKLEENGAKLWGRLQRLEQSVTDCQNLHAVPEEVPIVVAPKALVEDTPDSRLKTALASLITLGITGVLIVVGRWVAIKLGITLGK